jgi:hypothetical protein
LLVLQGLGVDAAVVVSRHQRPIDLGVEVRVLRGAQPRAEVTEPAASAYHEGRRVAVAIACGDLDGVATRPAQVARCGAYLGLRAIVVTDCSYALLNHRWCHHISPFVEAMEFVE